MRKIAVDAHSDKKTYNVHFPVGQADNMTAQQAIDALKHRKQEFEAAIRDFDAWIAWFEKRLT